MVGSVDWTDRLGPGEQVLWEGKPAPGMRFSWTDIPSTVVGLAFIAISLVFVVVLFPFGLLIPHLWVGLYVAFGRYPAEAKMRANTSYAVTDQRALILSTWPRRRFESINPGAVGAITLSERNDGTGTIVFGPGSAQWEPWSKSRRRSPSFQFVDHPAQVLQVINSVARGAPCPSPGPWMAGPPQGVAAAPPPPPPSADEPLGPYGMR